MKQHKDLKSCFIITYGLESIKMNRLNPVLSSQFTESFTEGQERFENFVKHLRWNVF